MGHLWEIQYFSEFAWIFMPLGYSLWEGRTRVPWYVTTEIYMLLIPSILPLNTPATARTEFIMNWYILPGPRSTPSLSLWEKQSSILFALGTSKEAPGLPNAVFQETGIWTRSLEWYVQRRSSSWNSPHHKMSGCLRSLFIDRLLFNFPHSNISMCYSWR